MDERPIGVFDSGVGGLTVVKQLMHKMPNENIVYFGDTARVPYGSKSKEAVTRFSRQIVRFLLSKDVKAIVIACNTVTSNSLEILQGEFDIPLFGVVKQGVMDAVNATRNKRIGIIGTAATIRSGAYEHLIKQYDKGMFVYSKACPLFVPLAEEGFYDNSIARLTAKHYLEEFSELDIDSLVLGCTHYPLLKRCIGETVGERVQIIDPAEKTAVLVLEFLKEHAMQADGGEKHVFYVSDITDKFSMISQKALKRNIEPEIIDIEKY